MQSREPMKVRRRGWERFSGLRSRLVLIVGVAMLAPGILAVMQAVSGYRSSLHYLRENFAKSAELVAREAESSITAAHEVLISLAAHPEIRAVRKPGCIRGLQREIGNRGQYFAASIIDVEGAVLCSTVATAQGLKVREAWFEEVLRGDSFVVSDLYLSSILRAWGMVAAAPMRDADGNVVGAISLFIDWQWLQKRYEAAAPAGRDVLVLLDQSGRLMTPDATRDSLQPGLPLDASIQDRMLADVRTFIARGQDRTWRLYAVSPMLERHMFVLLGTPLLTALGPLSLQVLWGVLLPLSMWALAVGVVWFGLNRLVVRWIVYLDRITSIYAGGRHNVRPIRSKRAPDEIRSLGATFNRMADLIEARETQLRESLGQKEMLVREIHHRVKNNLQLVMSLLNLHGRHIQDPRARQAFAEARDHINSLAILHRRLYESENLQELDLRWFLEDLCAELRRGGLSGGPCRVELTVDAPNEIVGSEIAVPLGLLVTEAITNAYKHAFHGMEQGRIDVKVERETPSMLKLTVRDNGAGPQLESDEVEHVGLGRSLIDAFVRQLQGELRIGGDDGMVIEVTFGAPLRTASAPILGPTAGQRD